jgi:hypothetical protein
MISVNDVATTCLDVQVWSGGVAHYRQLCQRNWICVSHSIDYSTLTTKWCSPNAFIYLFIVAEPVTLCA